MFRFFGHRAEGSAELDMSAERAKRGLPDKVILGSEKPDGLPTDPQKRIEEIQRRQAILNEIFRGTGIEQF